MGAHTDGDRGGRDGLDGAPGSVLANVHKPKWDLLA